MYRFVRCVLCCLPFLLALAAQAIADDADSPASKTGKSRGGIEKRTPWTTSRLTGSPDPPAPYAVQRVFPHLSFDQPVEMAAAPGGDRLFVMEVGGKVFSFPNTPQAKQPDLAIDLASDVNGFYRAYGLAFHPNYAENRSVFLCYVLDGKKPDGTRVSRFKVSQTDPPRIDAGSEQLLLTWQAGGHNGGCLKFGPEGYLYISAGDGGDAFPPDGRNSGQDVTNLLAGVMRIDVDHRDGAKPYRIPADNPFVDLPGARGEIWAYGMRNPWRMSFDPQTGALWVGDVGWELWEMVYRVQRGANYGWSLFEARQPVHRERRRGPTPIVPPTVEHSHTEARSITGGYVYHGSRLKELAGAYIYGDYVTGKIWGLRHDGQQVTWLKELVDTPLQVICFGVDHNQELYVVDYAGTIHRLVRNPRTAANEDFPTRLSQTGLFASVKDQTPAPGVIPYSINAEPWADGAVAQRYVALPGLAKLGVHDTQNVQVGTIKGDWKFPNDAVLAKTMSLRTRPGAASGARRLETQILHFDRDTWRSYSYIWNDEQTDAVLAGPEGADRTFTIADPDSPGGQRKQTYHFASRTECILCHTTRAGSIHGFKPEQLNKKVQNYGDVAANQLQTLDHIGLFEQPAPENPATMPDPYDRQADLQQRARAYLHVNCAHCHRRGGGGTAAIDVQYQFPLPKTNLLDARPTQGTFDMHAAQVLAPGDPYRSVLFYRMAKLGRGRMPHFGSNEIDPRGLALIHDWIAALPSKGHEPSQSTKALRAAQDQALQHLRSAGAAPAETKQALAELLGTTSGALKLLWAVGTQSLDPQINRRAIELATAADAAPQVRDLFERFLPEEKRIKRLGSVFKPEQILALSGDAARQAAVLRGSRRAVPQLPPDQQDRQGVGARFERDRQEERPRSTLAEHRRTLEKDRSQVPVLHRRDQRRPRAHRPAGAARRQGTGLERRATQGAARVGERSRAIRPAAEIDHARVAAARHDRPRSRRPVGVLKRAEVIAEPPLRTPAKDRLSR